MSYYVFSITKNISRSPQRLSVFYKHDNGSFSRSLADILDSHGSRQLPPDRIVFVCRHGLEEQIKEEYLVASQKVGDRLISISHIVILPFDSRGILVGDSIIFIKAKDTWLLRDKDLAEIISCGISQLIEETRVILTAPSGYVFCKPSQNSSDIFIRAGNMLKDPAALSLIFHSLVRIIPREIDILYIDSFTILSIAMSYQRWRDAFKVVNCSNVDLTIINIHSYSIDEKFRFPATGNYAVLISASTSGGFARKLVREHGAQDARIFHFLYFHKLNQRPPERCVFAKAKESAAVEQMIQPKEISIPGEEFLASHNDARAVSLTKRHFEGPFRKILRDSFYQRNFYLGTTTPVTFDQQAFFVDPKAGLGTLAFKNWLKREIATRLPPSIDLIVSVDSHRSFRLGKWIREKLAQFLGNSINVIAYDSLFGKSLPKTNVNSTILVVCDYEGSGDSLLRASKHLRSIPHDYRHYLVGHFFAPTRSHFARVKNNLVTSGRGRDYGWSSYMCEAIGDQSLHAVWPSEYEKWRGISRKKLGKRFPVGLREALLARGAFGSPRGACFLPDVNGNEMKINPDSVLFEAPYKQGISHSIIVLAVSVALQRARDHFDSHGRRFAEGEVFESSPFLDTVLDPSMFARFNDGVIQAAILRASFPRELNYSRNRALSENMRGIFLDLIRSKGNGSGEALIEFLFALSSGRLRLADSDQIHIIEKVHRDRVLAPIWKVFDSRPDF